MKKRILSFALTLVMVLSLFTISAGAATPTKVLDINWSQIAAVGNQDSSSSQACGCYATAYAKTILDGWPHSWSEFNTNRDSNEINNEIKASAWWAQGGYGINRPYSRSEVFTAAYNSINNGRPLIVYVTGRNNQGTYYQHYVAIVGYTDVSNPNSLSESNFLFIDSVPGATKSTTENLGACSRAYVLRTERDPSTQKYAYKYMSTNQGGVSSTSSGSSASAPTSSGSYFPACSSSYTSIVSALKSVGADSSYTYRQTIAAANSINNYTGSAAQNTQMLNLLKAGRLIKPGSSSSSNSAGSNIPTTWITLTPKCAPGMRLDVSGGSGANGANCQIYGANGTNAQYWRFIDYGNGYYVIQSGTAPKMVLDVAGGRTESGTNAQQYSWNGTYSQQFKLIDAGDGYYYICPRLNENLCLDVSGGGSGSGTNVWFYSRNNSDAQRWKIA